MHLIWSLETRVFFRFHLYSDCQFLSGQPVLVLYFKLNVNYILNYTLNINLLLYTIKLNYMKFFFQKINNIVFYKCVRIVFPKAFHFENMIN